MPDWSLLPEELLQLISKHLQDYCFDVVHARSVCTLWRSLFPFPSSLLRPSYSLPSFAKFPRKSKGFCTLKKVPLFLFRVRAPHADASEYFLGGIGRDDDHIELPSPLQCSVKVKIPDSDPTLINMLDCQVLALGHQYRIIGCNPKYYKGVAFLPLNKFGGGEEFVVLLNYTKNLLVLRSTEMRWMLLEIPSYGSCSDLITFRGRFYAAFSNHDIFAIDPYSLEATPLMPSEALLDCGSVNDLVPSGNDELFLVEKIIPRTGVIYLYRLTLRVSRLNEEAGKWVEVSEIGDRLLVIGNLGNVCCSAKELPDGCGLTGNSIVFTHGRKVTYSYKYGVHTGREEDDLNCWRYSRDKCVTILSTSPVVALRVETAKP
ncbi:F-box domain [Arabidopsis thaliana x Arabidopsis arenosa]|uniref:F-box domain n=1 Tax=Arabidopsis thaliana x Arabidopsis arenosa TaxID=1240361 RepID=A0A8T2A4N5_9BRAS|nr:F-box domain [Arabidopsis thaliana x Arabidopsis arenosa]KAG7567866.1 F-box domain [Arabidopsis thaliana x Arabidopsis arenosa]KAG7567867.1 F-box domain [Arabidopsis thaliana x Arabidopsis arenosa]